MAEILIATATFILYLAWRERMFRPVHFEWLDRLMTAALIGHYYILDGGRINLYLIFIFAFMTSQRLARALSTAKPQPPAP